MTQPPVNIAVVREMPDGFILSSKISSSSKYNAIEHSHRIALQVYICLTRYVTTALLVAITQ